MTFTNEQLLWIAGAAMGIIGFFIKRTLKQIDERFAAAKKDVDDLSEKLGKHQEASRLQFGVVEKDIKNLGDKIAQVFRQEIQQLREEATASRKEVSDRLDKILLAKVQGD